MERNVFIATPSYDGKVCCEYKNSILESAALCWGSGIGFTPCDWMHMSDLEVARSILLEKFRESDCTDLFWIDSDGGWSAGAFMQLLLSPKDVVCGLMPKKIPGMEDYSVFYNDKHDGTPIVDPNDGTISISLIGMAFMRMSRAAVERMVAHHSCDGLFPYRLFERVRDMNGRVMGEDYSFCQKWTGIGGEIWLFPNIDTVHVGTYRWKGNYHEYMIGQLMPGQQDSGR